MNKAPRSPRTVALLDSLQKIYTSEEASPAEKLEAARLAARILGKKHPQQRKKKEVKPSSPLIKGSDLAPARTDPAPDDILAHFRKLK